MKSEGRRLRIFVISGIIVLIVLAFAGYRYRGFIRLKMLNILHSFDDLPDTIASGKPDYMPPGAWGLARTNAPIDDDMTDIECEQLELLRSLGYLSGYTEVPVEMGVTVYDTVRTCPGYNILMSGHTPDVFLMDMNGEIVHSWFNSEVNLSNLWSDAQDEEDAIDSWRRTYLADNGDLTAIIIGGGIVKLDKDSNLLWSSEFICAHHDLDIDENGNVYALGRDIHINERYSPDEFIAEDYICIFDSLGNMIRRISTYDVLANSSYAPVLCERQQDGDILHCNTIEYIRPEMLPEDYTGPLRPGTVLLSHRAINLVCAVDLEEETVYWAESEFWHAQHKPTVLPDGTLLVFDNRGKQDKSTVLQFDPSTREVLWSYTGDEEHPFYSHVLGSCQRLPNGNTLIIESTMGRAFEVTAEGEIVWEFYNPHRAGDNNELIATLFDVVRVPSESVESWLTR
jgi:hypothetical protein